MNTLHIPQITGFSFVLGMVFWSNETQIPGLYSRFIYIIICFLLVVFSKKRTEWIWSSIASTLLICLPHEKVSAAVLTVWQLVVIFIICITGYFCSSFLRRVGKIYVGSVCIIGAMVIFASSAMEYRWLWMLTLNISTLILVFGTIGELFWSKKNPASGPSNIPFLIFLAICLVFPASVNIFLELGFQGLQINLLPFGYLFLGLWSDKQKKLDDKISAFMSRVPTVASKRFLKQMLVGHRNGSAVIGMKTSLFYMDWDPKNKMSSYDPFNLYLIRLEEINRGIYILSQEDLLDIKFHNSQIVGAFDKRISLTPCVDMLNVYCSVYLDVISLTQRRMTELFKLMPIVDQSFARVLESNSDISLEFDDWIYLLDFKWVDQQLIDTKSRSDYRVLLPNIMPESYKDAIYECYSQGLPPVIWLTQEAKNRVSFESSLIYSLIEVPTEGSKLAELNLSWIRIDSIIPLLQKYFSLDEIRNRLADYEPSFEAKQNTFVMEHAISKIRSVLELKSFLKSVVEFPWHGFKEKDHALFLVLKAKKHCETIYLVGVADLFLEAVQSIGYPSQIIHHAILQKSLLRDMNHLVEIATSPANRLFGESWLYLSNFDFSIYGLAQKQRVIQLLNTTSLDADLLKIEMVRRKWVEIFISLVKLDQQLICQANNTMVNRILRICLAHKELDIICFLMDHFQSIDGLSLSEINRRSINQMIESDYQNPLVQRLSRQITRTDG